MCPLYTYNARKGQGVPVHALQIYRGVGGSDGTGYTQVVGFTHRPLYPQQKNPH